MTPRRVLARRSGRWPPSRSDAALEPGDRDGGGETQGQGQGRARGLEAGGEKASRDGGCGSVVRSRSWACSGRGVQLLLLEGRGDRQEPPPARRPDDDERPADDRALRDRAAARIAEVVARIVGD